MSKNIMRILFINLLLFQVILSLEKLKLMTYNIHYGNSVDDKYNIEELGQLIVESKAEVVCLQEVDVNWGERSLYENTIEILSRITGLYYFFAPIYNRTSQRDQKYPNEQFGVGFLSKYPIIFQKNYNISRWSTQSEDPQPGDPGFPPKKGGFGNIIIDVNGKNISIYNTHLDYRATPPPGYSTLIREIQVKEMLDIIDFNKYPIILMGDMNTDTSAKEVFTPLLNHFNDAWSLGNTTEGYSFPSNDPIKRIDYILTSKDLEIMDSYLIFSLASDHLPVIVDIDINF